MGHQQLVVLGLALAVDDDVGAVAVGAEEDGLAVDLLSRCALDIIDGLEERVGDAVGEADELDVGGRGVPLGADGIYEA